MHLCVHVCVLACVPAYVRVCVCRQERQKGRRPFQGEVVMLSDKDKQRWGLLLPGEGDEEEEEGEEVCVSPPLFLLLSSLSFFQLSLSPACPRRPRGRARII